MVSLLVRGCGQCSLRPLPHGLNDGWGGLQMLHCGEARGAPVQNRDIAPNHMLVHDMCLFAWGLVWLAVGFVIYATARPATIFAFFPHASNPAAVPARLRWVLGPAPTFVHVIAFSLMSAAVIARTRRQIYGVCGAWAAIEVGFELAQHPAFRTWLAHHGASVFQIYLLGS